MKQNSYSGLFYSIPGVLILLEYPSYEFFTVFMKCIRFHSLKEKVFIGEKFKGIYFIYF